MLRHEVGVLAKPIARSLDLDDNGVVKQPIEQRGGDDGIAKNLPHSAKPRLEVRIMAPRS